MKQPLFQVLGLTVEEERIYLTLCESMNITLAGVARKTGIHRPRLYQLLPRLVTEGFLEERVIGKRTYYRAIEPRKLYDLIHARTILLGDEIDRLQTTYEKNNNKPDVQFLLGATAATQLFDDIADVVPKGGTIYRYSARRLDNESFIPSPRYIKRRALGHFERLAITSEQRAAKKEKRIDRLVKVIPEKFDLFDDNVSQMIYEDRTVIIDHDNNSIFTIRSKKIANFQRKLYRLLWKYLEDPKPKV